MTGENGHGNLPVEVFRAEPAFPPLPLQPPLWRPARRRDISLSVAIGLFGLTLLSTLAAGTQFAAAYAAGRAPLFDDFFAAYFRPFAHPRLFLTGLPFALTLVGILLAHELGHFFACRYYRIQASYPFFVPAPTLIGTLGAFIRIRSAIASRRALFDMALAGPLIGFLIAVPALAISIAHSRVVVGGNAAAPLVFGHPLIESVLEWWLRPGVPPENLLLSPVGRAAWVGLFATALNLIPAGQLDGGHILYTLSSARHRQISLGVALALVPLAYLWLGWAFWAVLLIVIGFRHPPLIDPWEPLDGRRRILAGVALAIFALCFMPSPFVV